MATNVKITCKYYQVREYRNGDITPNTYSLIPWLNRVGALALKDRYREVNGIAGRMENLVGIGESNIYALNFMRMDEVSTSYKLRKDTPAEHVDIEIGEYIAKNTVCLYDPDHDIMMIQSNRGGYSDASIESYINSFFEDKVCAISPIIEDVNVLSDRSEYMKFDVRIANIKAFRPHKGSFFEGVIEGMNRMEGMKAHIEVSLGRSKYARLDKEEMKAAIADVYDNKEYITSAKVKLNDDQIAGMYDLFDNMCKNDISITIADEDKGCLKFEKLSHKMFKIYFTLRYKERVVNAIMA